MQTISMNKEKCVVEVLEMFGHDIVVEEKLSVEILSLPTDFDYDWWKRLYKEYPNNENSSNIDENIDGGINYEINDNIKKDDVVYTEHNWK
jgi:hypothetical protein